MYSPIVHGITPIAFPGVEHVLVNSRLRASASQHEAQWREVAYGTKKELASSPVAVRATFTSLDVARPFVLGKRACSWLS